MSTTYFKRYRMEVDLRRRRFELGGLPPGYRLVAWHPELLEEHAETKFECFRDGIDAAVFPCLGELSGCHQLMDEIRSKEGLLPEATWLVQHRPLSTSMWESVGTIQGVRMSRRYGGIQNVGLTEPHRNRGIGQLLVSTALAGFQHVGVQRVYLEVTVQNDRAVKFYQRLGFRRTKTLYKAVELAYS